MGLRLVRFAGTVGMAAARCRPVQPAQFVTLVLVQLGQCRRLRLRATLVGLEVVRGRTSGVDVGVRARAFRLQPGVLAPQPQAFGQDLVQRLILAPLELAYEPLHFRQLRADFQLLFLQPC